MLSLTKGLERLGRYEILSELGRGSMGHVYLALDPNIQRKVAIKVFLPLLKTGRLEAAQLRERFILEARAAGRLRHPGIVMVYDADTDPETDLSYIAMEWIDGPSLQDLITETGPLEASRALIVAEQVAIALDAAHRRGLVHRDIKPANILISPEGQAKVTDFGIAKLSSASITGTGWIPGTPFYMSPEQVWNRGVDGRSDLYSLGVVLYQCLTGTVPFEGESLASLTYMILEIDPRPPQLLNPRISDDLAALIERMLAKSPGDRVQTGLQLAEALRSVSATDASQASQAVPPEQGEPPVAAVGATALLPSTEPPRPDDLGSTGGESRPAGRSDPRWTQTVWMTLSRQPWRTVAAISLLLVLLIVASLPAWTGGESPEPRTPVPVGKTAAVHPPAPSQEEPEIVLPDPPPVPPEAAEAVPELTPRPRARRAPPAAVAASPALKVASEPARRRGAEPDDPAAPAVGLDPAPGAGDDPAEAASLEPAVDVTNAPDIDPAPPPVASATLEIVYRNRLKAGSLSVWVGESKAWSTPVSAPEGALKRTLIGRNVWGQIPLAPGRHVIDVRITGAGGKLDVVKRVEAHFSAGETRRLKVSLLPTRFLKLRWTGAGNG